MATYSADQAAAGYPVAGGARPNCFVAFGEIDLKTALEANDVIEFLKLPKGAVPVFGLLQGEDIDTDESEALEIDIGTSADTVKYSDSGVITGDAVAGVKQQAGVLHFLQGKLADTLQAGGLAAEETVIGTVTAAPTAGGTGVLRLTIFYLMAVTQNTD